MSRAYFTWGLVLGTLSCARANAPDSGEGHLRVVSVEPDSEQRPSVVILRWHGDFEKAGELYGVLDEGGYRGLVRTRGVAKVDCDHCPGPLVEATVVEGKGPRAEGSLAFGPVSGPTPRAKIARVPRGGATGPDAGWKPVLHLDLDGDGSWDFDQVERCGHSVPSGCKSQVCDMVCTAVARSGAQPDPRFVDCISFVPDVEDCEPSP